MQHITVTNVNQALYEVTHNLFVTGREENSRNGKVLASNGPMMVTYNWPKERVLFSPMRDANPFFHLMEAIWMMGGKKDLAFPRMFNSKFGQFSDDGLTLHGAYGHRWRRHFGRDQVLRVIDLLAADPTTRRAVISMWDPAVDLIAPGIPAADLPCNTTVYFRPIVDHDCTILDMTVCNRSNDVFWGMCGANAVHMSILHEVVAIGAGMTMGKYHQFTNNAHIYTGIFPIGKIRTIGADAKANDRYRNNGLSDGKPIAKDAWQFMYECELFTNHPDSEFFAYKEPFIADTVVPMYRAWKARKEGNMEECYEQLSRIDSPDWQIACIEWVDRRNKEV